MPLFLLSLVACPFDENRDCTTEIVPSVAVYLTDASGAPISGATVTAAVDGEEEPCDEWGDAYYACGEDRAGSFVVTVEAEGYASSVSEPIEVVEGECHVDGQELDVVLAASS